MVFAAASAKAVVGATARAPAADVASVSRAALREKVFECGKPRIPVLLRVGARGRVFTLNVPGLPSLFSWLFLGSFLGLDPLAARLYQAAPESDTCSKPHGSRRDPE
jgi:hypothetical protein